MSILLDVGLTGEGRGRLKRQARDEHSSLHMGSLKLSEGLTGRIVRV
jgi:hypothetical protein